MENPVVPGHVFNFQSRYVGDDHLSQKIAILGECRKLERKHGVRIGEPHFTNCMALCIVPLTKPVTVLRATAVAWGYA